MDTTASAALPPSVTGGPSHLPRVGDELLARAAARGSDRAFAAIYERYHQAIYAYCRSIVRHDQDAQDVVQATFTNALSALASRRPRAPLRPWLYRIAHNEAISLIRRRRRHRTESLDESTAPLGRSAEEEAGHRHRWAQLTADLAQLPDRQRQALLLRELSGLSHAEIAIVLGASVGGAKQAILEARRALTELNEGRAMDCDTVRQRISDGDRRVLRGRRIGAHLRSCGSCAAFAESIDRRQAQLRALSPVLPAGAAATLLAGAIRGGLVHGARAGSSGPACATGAGVAGKALAIATTWKAVTGTAVILATASAGVAELHHVIVSHHHRSAPVRRRAEPARAAPAAGLAARPGGTVAGSGGRVARARLSDVTAARRPARGWITMSRLPSAQRSADAVVTVPRRGIAGAGGAAGSMLSTSGRGVSGRRATAGTGRAAGTRSGRGAAESGRGVAGFGHGHRALARSPSGGGVNPSHATSTRTSDPHRQGGEHSAADPSAENASRASASSSSASASAAGTAPGRGQGAGRGHGHGSGQPNE